MSKSAYSYGMSDIVVNLGSSMYEFNVKLELNPENMRIMVYTPPESVLINTTCKANHQQHQYQLNPHIGIV